VKEIEVCGLAKGRSTHEHTIGEIHRQVA